MQQRLSQTAAILFPLATGVLASLAVPSSAPLVGMLMFGNLLRECGVTEHLKKTAGGAMIDIVTLLLGLVVGATMGAANFLNVQTLMILVLGAVAFSFSTPGGIVFAKIINLFLREGRKINPCIGAAGVSAVPMSARVVQQFVSQETNGRVNPPHAGHGTQRGRRHRSGRGRRCVPVDAGLEPRRPSGSATETAPRARKRPGGCFCLGPGGSYPLSHEERLVGLRGLRS